MIPEKSNLPQTDPNEFARWLGCFPLKVREGIWFIPISPKAKEPAVPRGQSWKDEKFRLTADEAAQRLSTGGNVGVVARGDLVVGDVDDVKKAAELKLIPDDLIDTLVSKTRDGKLHLYYENDGVENRDYTENGSKIIELRAVWRYVLAPGSWVPPTPGSGGDGLYKVVNEKPPLTLKPEMLPWLKPKSDYATFAPVNFEGEFMGLPCVKVLFEVKLKDGRQTHGAKLLGIAWIRDHGGKADGFAPIAQRFAAFQSRSEKPVRWRYVFGRATSASRNNLAWSCGEMITLLRDNGIYPPCSGCPMKMEAK